jgi:hypothetical protein
VKRLRRDAAPSSGQVVEAVAGVVSPGSPARAGSASASSTGLAAELPPSTAQGMGTATSPLELDSPDQRALAPSADVASEVPGQGAQEEPRAEPPAQTEATASPGPSVPEVVATSEAPPAPAVEVAVDPSAARASTSVPAPAAVVAPTSAPVRALIAPPGGTSSQARGGRPSGTPDCVERVRAVRARRFLGFRCNLPRVLILCPVGSGDRGGKP